MPYSEGLAPAPLLLHPHMVACERLQLWEPARSSRSSEEGAENGVITEEHMRRVFAMMNAAWADSTKETYSTGLLLFHVFCDFRNIPEEARAPVTHGLLEAFVAAAAGAYLRSSIKNFLAVIRAWHLLHNVHWDIDETRIQALLRAAETIPSLIKKEKEITLHSRVFTGCALTTRNRSFECRTTARSSICMRHHLFLQCHQIGRIHSTHFDLIQPIDTRQTK